MVSEVVSPEAVPEPSSAAAGSSSSAKPFVNKSISIRLDETNYLLWRQQVLFAIDSLALGSHIDGSATVPSQHLVVNGVRALNPDQQPYKLDGVCNVLLDTEARHPMPGSWGEFGPAGFVGQASSTDVNGPQVHSSSRRFSQDSFRAQRANLANPSSFQGGRSNFYRGRGGRVFGGRSRPQCQLCGRVGHLVNRCYYRFDQSYDGFCSANFVEEVVDVQGLNAESTATQDLGGTVALVSGDFSPVVCEDASWFPDSSATAHLTPDAGMLRNSVPYVGAGKISVANGESIPISRVGNIMLPSNSRSLVLSNLLHVPSVKKNMLSVSKFTKDNNVSIEFFPDSCVVKDLQTRHVMLQGGEISGLYKLSSSSLLQQPSSSCNSDCLHVEGEEICFPVSSILGTALSDPSSNASEGGGLQLLQPGSLVSQGGFQSSPVGVEAPSSGDYVSQPMIMSPMNARGSRSAPIVYRRKAKTVFGQQQSIVGNSCLQPAQTVSGVPVDNSTLQPIQNVSARPVVSSGLQSDRIDSSDRTASIPNISSGTDQTVHENSARSVSDRAISDATSSISGSDRAANVLSQNQTVSLHPMVTRSKTGSLKPKVFLTEKMDYVLEAKNDCYLSENDLNQYEPHRHKRKQSEHCQLFPSKTICSVQYVWRISRLERKQKRCHLPLYYMKIKSNANRNAQSSGRVGPGRRCWILFHGLMMVSALYQVPKVIPLQLPHQR
ncbi:hypothetical protein GQ457_08G013570 [Hibiscus cannabinus]